MTVTDIARTAHEASRVNFSMDSWNDLHQSSKSAMEHLVILALYNQGMPVVNPDMITTTTRQLSKFLTN